MTERPPWNRRTTPLPEPHLARLQKRVARGQSLEEAAKGVGLTLSLAKSVFIRSGLPVPRPMRRRPGPPSARVVLGKRLHEHLRQVDSATAPDLAEALGVTTAQVNAAVWDVDRERILPAPTVRERYSDTAVLIGLQLMALERGRRSSERGMVPVSAGYWDAHRDPAAHPPASDVRERFGTWVAACRAAGIPTHAYTKRMGARRRWSDEELHAALAEFFAAGVGDSPTAFAEWTRTRPDAPAFGTVVSRLGRWTDVRERFRG